MKLTPKNQSGCRLYPTDLEHFKSWADDEQERSGVSDPLRVFVLQQAISDYVKPVATGKNIRIGPFAWQKEDARLYLGIGSFVCFNCENTKPASGVFVKEMKVKKQSYIRPHYFCEECAEAAGAEHMHDHGFAFESICDNLGLDAGKIRGHVAANPGEILQRIKDSNNKVLGERKYG